MIKNDEVLDALFHYTDIGAVASIIKNRKLWLSNAAFQNDSQEMLEGYDFLRKSIDDYGKTPDVEENNEPFWYLQGVLAHVETSKYSHDIFTCSFSRAPDLLSQWRAYGSFAIEFSRGALSEAYKLYDCVYDASQKTKVALELMNEFFLAHRQLKISGDERRLKALRPLIKAMGTFKSQHFEAEHEVRLIESGAGGVLHRPRNNHLIPYIEMDFNPEAILSIHIGPVPNQDLTEASIVSLLRNNGLRDVPIVRSVIPYRS